MGRTPNCRKVRLNRDPWTPEEDLLLINSIQIHGEGRWRSLSKKAGLLRCGKSCRLRWMNYLRPDVKRGDIMPDEEDLILKLHRLLGNRWSLIAGRLPGRTDNDIKNYWNSHLSKKLIREGIDPRTHRPLSESEDIWWNPLDRDRQQQILQCSSSRISENVNTESIESHDGQTPSPRNHDNANHTNFNEILEMADMVHPTDSEVACNELSNTNCAAPSNATFCGFPYSCPATPLGTANSYVYSSFLESFINEEFHDLRATYTTGHNFVQQLRPNESELRCTQHSPSAQFHPSPS